MTKIEHKREMSEKIGNTSRMVFTILGQFCWHTANGYEVALSPYPDVPNPDNRITFKVIDSDIIEVDPVVRGRVSPPGGAVFTHSFDT